MLTARRSARELEDAVPVGRVSGCSSCAQVRGATERGWSLDAYAAGALLVGGTYFVVSRVLKRD